MNSIYLINLSYLTTNQVLRRGKLVQFGHLNK